MVEWAIYVDKSTFIALLNFAEVGRQNRLSKTLPIFVPLSFLKDGGFMATLEIKVRNQKGEKVVFENDFIPVAKYREYLEMVARHEDEGLALSEAVKLDEQLVFIASLFPGLDSELMYQGLEMAELNEIIGKIFVRLIGAEDDPKGSD